MRTTYTNEQKLAILEELPARTADALVEAAKDPMHPLHGHFVWDNDDAGERYRLSQARGFIASVRVEVEPTRRVVVDGVTITSMPAHVSPRASRPVGGGYISTTTPEGLAALREEGVRSVAQWLRRYGVAFGDDPMVEYLEGWLDERSAATAEEDSA